MGSEAAHIREQLFYASQLSVGVGLEPPAPLGLNSLLLLTLPLFLLQLLDLGLDDDLEIAVRVLHD